MNNLTIMINDHRSDGSELGDFMNEELKQFELIPIAYGVNAFLHTIIFGLYYEFLLKKISGNPDNAGMCLNDMLKKLPPITTSLIQGITGCSEDESLFILRRANEFSKEEMAVAHRKGSVVLGLFYSTAIRNTELQQAHETDQPNCV